eukprot:5386402-Prymnesium_polylepis.1
MIHSPHRMIHSQQRSDSHLCRLHISVGFTHSHTPPAKIAPKFGESGLPNMPPPPPPQIWQVSVSVSNGPHGSALASYICTQPGAYWLHVTLNRVA